MASKDLFKSVRDLKNDKAIKSDPENKKAVSSIFKLLEKLGDVADTKAGSNKFLDKKIGDNKLTRALDTKITAKMLEDATKASSKIVAESTKAAVKLATESAKRSAKESANIFNKTYKSITETNAKQFKTNLKDQKKQQLAQLKDPNYIGNNLKEDRIKKRVNKLNDIDTRSLIKRTFFSKPESNDNSTVLDKKLTWEEMVISSLESGRIAQKVFHRKMLKHNLNNDDSPASGLNKLSKAALLGGAGLGAAGLGGIGLALGGAGILGLGFAANKQFNKRKNSLDLQKTRMSASGAVGDDGRTFIQKIIRIKKINPDKPIIAGNLSIEELGLASSEGIRLELRRYHKETKNAQDKLSNKLTKEQKLATGSGIIGRFFNKRAFNKDKDQQAKLKILNNKSVKTAFDKLTHKSINSKIPSQLDYISNLLSGIQGLIKSSTVGGSDILGDTDKENRSRIKSRDVAFDSSFDGISEQDALFNKFSKSRSRKSKQKRKIKILAAKSIAKSSGQLALMHGKNIGGRIKDNISGKFAFAKGIAKEDVDKSYTKKFINQRKEPKSVGRNIKGSLIKTLKPKKSFDGGNPTTIKTKETTFGKVAQDGSISFETTKFTPDPNYKGKGGILSTLINLWTTMKGFSSRIFTFLKTPFKYLAGFFGKGGAFRNFFSGKFGAVKSFFGKGLTAVTSFFGKGGAFRNFISGKFGAAKDFVIKGFGTVKSLVGGIGTKIKGFLAPIGKALGGVLGKIPGMGAVGSLLSKTFSATKNVAAKTLSTVGKKLGITGGKKLLTKGGTTLLAKGGGKLLTKLGGKVALKVGAKVGGKLLSRLVPGLGWVMTAKDVYDIGSASYGLWKANSNLDSVHAGMKKSSKTLIKKVFSGPQEFSNWDDYIRDNLWQPKKVAGDLIKGRSKREIQRVYGKIVALKSVPEIKLEELRKSGANPREAARLSKITGRMSSMLAFINKEQVAQGEIRKAASGKAKSNIPSSAKGSVTNQTTSGASGGASAGVVGGAKQSAQRAAQSQQETRNQNEEVKQGLTNINSTVASSVNNQSSVNTTNNTNINNAKVRVVPLN